MGIANRVLTRARRILGPLMLAAPVLTTAAGCGGRTPTQPPPPDGPFTSCPASIEVQSPDGNPYAVTYALPGASGGTPPLTVACAPQSGTLLPVGVHTITCTAADTLGHTASCTFTATVKGPPRLTLTKFIAFGDSITLGVKSDPPTFSVLALPHAYSFSLEGLLRERYRLQTPIVVNEGMGGEKVDGAPTRVPSGMLRLPGVLNAQGQGAALLLMEGTNDLLDFEAGVARAVAGLRTMIGEAKGRNVPVLLATIPPQRSGGARQRDAVARRIPGFNDQIRALAASEGVPLVDVYDEMKDRLNLIGVDDLHPTPEGHGVIAQTFFDAIRTHLEVKPPSQ